MKRLNFRDTRCPLALALAGVLGVGSAQAANITVTDGGDAGTSSTCTLRQAVEASNANAPVGACPAGFGPNDSINFDVSLANATITLAQGQLVVTESMRLYGMGQVIDADGNSRVILVQDTQKLAASNVTITGGNAAGAGGGIYLGDQADLELVESTVTGNQTVAEGGGIYGRMKNDVSVIQSTLNNNIAHGAYGGGGLYLYYATAEIRNSTITGNSSDASGGGIYARNKTELDIEDSTISKNSAVVSGGGIVFTLFSTVSMSRSIVSGNTVAGVPGDVAGDGTFEPKYSLLGMALQADHTGYGNVFTDDPGLGALGDHGGRTPTMVPTITSAAIDMESCDYNADYDQRGRLRGQVLLDPETPCDAGAVEASFYDLDHIFSDDFEPEYNPV